MAIDISSLVHVIRGDITKTKVDAIVNAANSSLLGGGGVDGAIHRAGGPAILEDCRRIIAKQGSCKTGEAVITTAGQLPATYVIHTVGPVYNSGKNKEEEKLKSCYQRSLQLAVEHTCQSIAFPNISTGVYRFPKDLAAQCATTAVIEFLLKATYPLQIYFVCFDEENEHLTQEALDQKLATLS